MTLLYADPSALARAYLADEPDHAMLREMLLAGPDQVVTSALARVELASAIRAAAMQDVYAAGGACSSASTPTAANRAL